MRVLVVGAGGQVGRRVAQVAQARSHTVYGTYRTRPPTLPDLDRAVMDKSDPDEVRMVFDRFRPDLVVDTGAIHQVDYCEAHRDEALAVNRSGTGHIARACAERGARLVYVSTDFVFGGEGTPPHTEADRPDPLSVYGETKLLGERDALASCPTTAVVRPSVVFSRNDLSGPSSSSGKNLDFATWVVGQLAGGTQVRAVVDQVASPTLADDLARAIVRLGESDRTGVFHTAGTTPCSRHEFAVRLARSMGFREDLITPVRTVELGQLARRPSNSSLDSGKLEREVGHRMMGLDEAISEFARPNGPAPS